MMKPKIVKPVKKSAPAKAASFSAQLEVVTKWLRQIPDFLLLRHHRWIELVLVVTAAGIALYIMATIHFAEPAGPAASSLPPARSLAIEQLAEFEQWLAQQRNVGSQPLNLPTTVSFR